MEICSFYRNQFHIPIVAITGTSGKTTTKEMIKHILSADRKVTATTLSSNSRTASLQYLLGIEDETEAAVLKQRLAHQETSRMREIFQTDNRYYYEYRSSSFKLLQNIRRLYSSKGEMLDIIHPKGTLIINAEDVNTKN